MTDPRILLPFDPLAPEYIDGRCAVVAFSGGQDSTTCLHYAIERYGIDNVLAISFDYGQRHKVELDCAANLIVSLGLADRWARIDVPAFSQLADAALTNPGITVESTAGEGSGNAHALSHGLPSTFVPGRNLVFLGLAAAYGIPRGATVLVTGVCEQDRAGYPDCRREFVESFVDTTRLAMDTPEFCVDAPLLHRDKAQTWQLAADLRCLDTIRLGTHTCYEGDHETWHDWGYGCGQCPACAERAKGWETFAASGVL